MDQPTSYVCHRRRHQLQLQVVPSVKNVQPPEGEVFFLPTALSFHPMKTRWKERSSSSRCILLLACHSSACWEVKSELYRPDRIRLHLRTIFLTHAAKSLGASCTPCSCSFPAKNDCPFFDPARHYRYVLWHVRATGPRRPAYTFRPRHVTAYGPNGPAGYCSNALL